MGRKWQYNLRIGHGFKRTRPRGIIISVQRNNKEKEISCSNTKSLQPKVSCNWGLMEVQSSVSTNPSFISERGNSVGNSKHQLLNYKFDSDADEILFSDLHKCIDLGGNCTAHSNALGRMKKENFKR